MQHARSKAGRAWKLSPQGMPTSDPYRTRQPQPLCLCPQQLEGLSDTCAVCRPCPFHWAVIAMQVKPSEVFLLGSPVLFPDKGMRASFPHISLLPENLLLGLRVIQLSPRPHLPGWQGPRLGYVGIPPALLSLPGCERIGWVLLIMVQTDVSSCLKVSAASRNADGSAGQVGEVGASVGVQGTLADLQRH